MPQSTFYSHVRTIQDFCKRRSIQNIASPITSDFTSLKISYYQVLFVGFFVVYNVLIGMWHNHRAGWRDKYRLLLFFVSLFHISLLVFWEFPPHLVLLEYFKCDCNRPFFILSGCPLLAWNEIPWLFTDFSLTKIHFSLTIIPRVLLPPSLQPSVPTAFY